MMTLPSGDQTGFDDTESTSRTGAPPATGTLNTRMDAPTRAPTASHLPSGDHEEAPRTSSCSATVRAMPPSAVTQRRVDRAARLSAKQAVRPSGDTAGALTIAPSA